MSQLQKTFEEVALYLTPLATVRQSADGLGAFLRAFGVDASRGTSADLQAVQGFLDAVAGSAAALKQAAGSQEPDPAVLHAAFDALTALPTSNPLIDDDLAADVVHSLAQIYLGHACPLCVGVLEALGVLEARAVVPSDPGGRDFEFARVTLDWRRLLSFLTETDEWAHEVYGWGGPSGGAGRAFDHQKAIRALVGLVESSQLATTRTRELSAPEAPFLQGIAGGDEVVGAWLPVLQNGLSSFDADADPVFAQEAGLRVLPFGDVQQPETLGLALAPYAKGGGAASVPLADRLTLTVAVDAQTTGGPHIVISPARTSFVFYPAGPIGGGSARAAFTFRIVRDTDDGVPLVLIGDEDAPTLTAEALSFEVGGTLAPSFHAEVKAAGMRATIPSGSDGFLQTLVGEGASLAVGDVGVGWSSAAGVRILGGGALSVTLPLHVSLGPIQIASVRVEVGVDAPPSVSVRLVGSVQLGPLQISVDGIGVSAEVASPERTGGLPVDLFPAFVPPDGVGLAVDAGVVVGGGYLFFDRDRAEYAGVLQLEVGEIAVQAVGLLTTRMPDGSDGFSLLLIITAEFPPVQLGFGFTLNGLGGLLGVNRTVAVDVLREGLRSRTLDAVMFPEDPVRNAPQIVSDLRRAFPPAPDQYVLGPMAVLGWGTPPLLRAELGVVLELPSPLRLVVMGQLAAAFPSFEVDPKLVDIKMDVLGVLDFGRKEASLDAALYDSRVSVYALEGEMAMRVRWGGDPSFALAVGGMHPRFQPPPGFPDLRRVSIALGKGNNPRLRLEGYLALTSNSVQVGARLDLFAKAGGASVRGELGFDALFEFDPFRFEVAIRARVTVRAFGASVGVGLRLTLSGPTPWRAKGRVSIEICWVDVSVGFDVTLGPRTQPALPPPADVWALLAAALADARAWSAELPGGGHQLATLREDPAGGAVAVHPLGRLAVRQRVVPLDTVLETYGGAPVEGARRFTVAGYYVGAPAAAATATPVPEHLDEHFAPAQFFAMSDEEKVAAPSFEAMPAGVGGIGAGGLSTAWATNVGPTPHAEKTYRLVTEVVDQDPLPAAAGAARTADYDQGADGLEAAAAFGAAAHDPLRHTGRARFGAAPLGLGLDDTAYAVADARTLRAVDPDALPVASVLRDRLQRRTARTYAGARAAVRAHVRAVPHDRDRYTVLAEHELAHV